MQNAPFIISLIEPQIPPNTGNIARLCVANNIELHIVGKIGFDINDKRLKRAGLDYWPFLNWKRFESTEEYFDSLKMENFYLLTKKQGSLYTDIKYPEGCYFLFGSETKGISEEYLESFSEKCLRIPMSNSNVRCLNLSNSAAIVAYEAIRQFNL